MATGWAEDRGHAVLEAVLVVDGLEIRPYTTGFGSESPNIGVALMAPRAHGRVSLVSADPSMPPRIEHRYDSEPADLAALQGGYERVGDLLDGITALGPPQWSTSQHLCGTAPMGLDDEDAVVDPQCRVRGVANLWVVDGSVLPKIPGRGPHATIAVLAHRAAEFFP
jgi:choline dehydrogenase-like flavoprotein